MAIKPPEFQITSAHRVACDGGEGALGHPRVWLTVDPDRGYVECPYCDKLYVEEDRAQAILANMGLSQAG